jgi:hypothetical protein
MIPQAPLSEFDEQQNGQEVDTYSPLTLYHLKVTSSKRLSSWTSRPVALSMIGLANAVDEERRVMKAAAPNMPVVFVIDKVSSVRFKKAGELVEDDVSWPCQPVLL